MLNGVKYQPKIRMEALNSSWTKSQQLKETRTPDLSQIVVEEVEEVVEEAEKELLEEALAGN